MNKFSIILYFINFISSTPLEKRAVVTCDQVLNSGLLGDKNALGSGNKCNAKGQKVYKERLAYLKNHKIDWSKLASSLPADKLKSIKKMIP